MPTEALAIDAGLNMHITSAFLVIAGLLLSASICNAQTNAECNEAYDRTKRIHCDPTFDRVCLHRAFEELQRCHDRAEVRSEEEERRQAAGSVEQGQRRSKHPPLHPDHPRPEPVKQNLQEVDVTLHSNSQVKQLTGLRLRLVESRKPARREAAAIQEVELDVREV